MPDLKVPVETAKKPLPAEEHILTPQAVQFLIKLHEKFDPRRLELIKLREQRQKKLDSGEQPQFLSSTEDIRKDTSWKVASTPDDLQRRWVEITGPTDRKMLINALNSGADVFMADFEDANAPTWKNMLEGQQNLYEAVRGTIGFTSAEGKQYKLNPTTAVLMVRPRGWHLEEHHFRVKNAPIAGSLFDFGLYFFHNAQALIDKGSGPYFYLPKMENHLEARLWNEVFIFAQQELNIPRGTIRATVLLETILAAFEMEEILYELREHSAGLNAGRWDYIFSIIKKFHARKDFVFPDRALIAMTVPFMRAYTQLLIQTCHRRGAHALGGMAAFIPSRNDPSVNEIALSKVREDKVRESSDGFDGTWVAHPDLVKISRDIFEKALQQKPHQKEKIPSGTVTAAELADFNIPGGKISEEGMRKNISIALQYIYAWLSGIGAAAIYNLMEDVATAEISRAQLWQWLHHPAATLKLGLEVNIGLYNLIIDQEMLKMAENSDPEKLKIAKKLLDEVVLPESFVSFLTIKAYNHLR
ncbi:MAG: malate synthase A [Parachlamydiales bacterium]